MLCAPHHWGLRPGWGDVVRLSSRSGASRRALGRTLEMAQALGGSEHGVDLLRKESLSALSPAAARRVLVHSYTAIIPITSLPFPPLPSIAAPNGGA